METHDCNGINDNIVYIEYVVDRCGVLNDEFDYTGWRLSSDNMIIDNIKFCPFCGEKL